MSDFGWTIVAILAYLAVLLLVDQEWQDATQATPMLEVQAGRVR